MWRGDPLAGWSERDLLLLRCLGTMSPDHAARLLRWYPDLRPVGPAAPERAGAPPRAEEAAEAHAEPGRRSGEARRAKGSDRDARIVEAPAAPERAGAPPRAEEVAEAHAALGRRSGEVRRAKVSDRDARIVEARKAGLSQNAIARREGVSRGAVLKALARHRARGA